jgi:ferrous iron transport protein B
MFCMYAIGLVFAPLVALCLKRTLLRGETPVFVMEMPLYKVPSMRTVFHRVKDSAWAFIRRAGTLILASMVVVWALLYFPRTESQEQTDAYLTGLKREAKSASDERKQEIQEEIEQVKQDGLLYDAHHGELKRKADEAEGKEKKRLKEEMEKLNGQWKRQSWLGRMGQAIEPVVEPLGWDWKIGMAALASFPAREVVVGTLGIIYNLGKVESDELRDTDNPADNKLVERLQVEPIFSVPVALSVMVFFALCCQCVSTLAVIRRETNSWRWPLFTFVYMTALAYLGALVVYQVGWLLMNCFAVT